MRKRNLLLAAVVAAAGLAVPAQAWAEPSGCTHSYPQFWVVGVSGRYSMHSWGDGSCSTNATRTFRVEIKHQISLQPDPLVSHSEDYDNNTYYAAQTDTCDHGKTAKYYGRSFFTSSPTYHDSNVIYVDAC